MVASFSVAVYAFTAQGCALALRLAEPLAAEVYIPDTLVVPADLQPGKSGVTRFERLGPLLGQTFRSFDCHLFIAACGIAVRSVAPYLEGKARDPAVLVMDQRGRHVISLLSGHLGGANAMAARVAALAGAEPVITTATDVEGLPALDVLAVERGLAIGNLEAVKAISAALLRGERVDLDDPLNRLGIAGGPWERLFSHRGGDPSGIAGGGGTDAAAQDGATSSVRIAVTERAARLPGVLHLHPRTLACGVGCKKGVPAPVILEAITGMLAQSGYASASVACLASIDAKRDEAGLCAAARRLGVPLRFFAPDTLAAFPPVNPSPKALERFGVAGVCESAALAAAAELAHGSVLLEQKRSANGVTVALAGPAAARQR